MFHIKLTCQEDTQSGSSNLIQLVEMKFVKKRFTFNIQDAKYFQGGSKFLYCALM